MPRSSPRRPFAVYYDCMGYQASNLDLLESLFQLVRLPTPDFDRPELLAKSEVLFAPLGWRVSEEKMQSCPKLVAVVSNTTGIPHIDEVAAAKHGVSICALHEQQEFLAEITATAEHAIGLMLAASRRLPSAHVAAARGAWNRRPWGAPRMLSRMRLGIVGYGRLGQKVAAIARAMNMAVDYFDPYVEGGTNSLIDLAACSDVLTLHAVSNAETYKIVDKSIIDQLPAGAMLINTARGELLDENALLESLRSGHLWAAGLDTIDGEFDPGFEASFETHPLAVYARSNDNLILTPHIGGSTIDAWFETERRVIDMTATELGLYG